MPRHIWKYGLDILNTRKSVMILVFNSKQWDRFTDADAGKVWRQDKGMTEDEMVGCHHWLNGDKIEQAPGDGEGQGSLACCSPRGGKESDMTEWLKNNKMR